MRIFRTFTEAKSEIQRDLKEMGVKIENTRMQDKQGSFPTLEIVNYGYTVLEPDVSVLSPTPVWAELEWLDREKGIEGIIENPGTAWKKRKDIWASLLEYGGSPIQDGTSIEEARLKSADMGPARFSYTYAERLGLNDQVWKVIRELRTNPYSRQLYISMWNPCEDPDRFGKRRVPCSLGWHVMYRENRLHMTYTMRSCDFFTHWQNDVYLAVRLLDFICAKAGMRIGHFSQFINSFHVYEKDVAHVF